MIAQENKQHKEQSWQTVSHSYVDCAEKERKQSVMWLQNIKCLHKSSTTYGNVNVIW